MWLSSTKLAPGNTDLRQKHTRLGLTITAAASELAQWPSKISLLERGLLRNHTLAANYLQWLTEQQLKSACASLTMSGRDGSVGTDEAPCVLEPAVSKV